MIFINGVVITGQKRGKQLGFPTANIRLTRPIPEGVYFSYVHMQGASYPALTFIGNAKTFDESDFRCETYILDFDRDIYGQNLEIELVKKIRDNLKFDTPEHLVRQMEIDRKLAQEYFSKGK